MIPSKLDTLVKSVKSMANWRASLTAYGLARLGANVGDLTVELRDGTIVETPAYFGASGPVFEVLAADTYHIRELSKYMAEPEVILDIGAHVGSASVSMHRYFPDSHYICYEPSSSSIHYLRSNLKRNQVKSTVHEAAVGAKSGWATLVEDSNASCGTTVQPADEQSNNGSQVKIVSFDEVVAGIRSRIGIVKLDCEGYEYEIVESSKLDSWQDVRCVLLEYHSVTGRNYREIIEKFDEMGFVIVRHSKVGPRSEGRGEICFFRQAR